MSSPPARGPAALRALVGACHPVPTAGVTTLVTALAAVAGNTWATVVLVALAVLTGQLSIGWSNDLIDADRDIAVRRLDKPLATGDVSPRLVLAASTVAAALTVALSLALGWRAGCVHLVAVASGWAYNFGLKATVLSVIPYIVTFGLFPAVATLPLPGHPWPPAWVVLAGALIGVSAHFGNAAPDMVEDLRAGVRGLPHHLGRTGAGVAACVAASAAVATIVVARAAWMGRVEWVVATVALVVAGWSVAVLQRNPRSEAAFYGSMIIAALGVTLLALSGGTLPSSACQAGVAVLRPDSPGSKVTRCPKTVSQTDSPDSIA